MSNPTPPNGGVRSEPAPDPAASAGISFYHLTTTPLERALPKLLEKALSAGFKALLVAESDSRIEQLNQLLWTYDPNSFLPHGSTKDGHAADQPILLSSALEAPNGANLLVITDGRTPETFEPFTRILDIFDGSDEAAVTGARSRWNAYKAGGCDLTYFKQTEAGGWSKKDN